MEFPITKLLDYESSVAWIIEHFHPTGLKCPMCGKPWIIEHFHPTGLKCPMCGKPKEQAREFRRTKRSQLVVYRCRGCHMTYTLYSGTVFQQTHLTPMQVVLLMRGFCKGESSKELAEELELN